MPPRRAVAAAPPVVQDDHADSPELVDDQHLEEEGPQDPVTADEAMQNPVDSRQASAEAETTASLTQAILLMTQELRRRQNPTPKAKAKEPDTFDGTEPKKLNNFILQCNLFFRGNSAYSDDSNKVNLALSYLRGTALEYFEPTILDSDEVPDWMDDWSAFIRTLRTQFGPIDPTADAEDGIDNLKMADNHHILRYNVDFNRFAVRTGWDEAVLRHRYYSGLAERIKDIMGQQGKPPTLEAMKALAHSIDARHWERLREKSRQGRLKAETPDKPDKPPKTDNKTTPPTPGSSNKGNKGGKPGKPAASGSAPLSDKLGKDGKLTPQERQRRFDNNLCLFCGGTGHTARECPKSGSSASKAKARAAQAMEEEASDTKKG
jgi:retrotransposon gag protein/zinc knuckle protein